MTNVPLDKKTTAVTADKGEPAIENTLAHIAEDHARHITPPPAPVAKDADLPNRRSS
ncbi:hypothetical protein [Streptomyces sp. NBC_00588]|uniref:hypothetical protein n=1 Tax=Streptomyces sp. NBC_00588 TaxID=2975784 RepID=UPI002E808D3F|nr:hypothetical protein [Streptomyces sp. NBC_00588]WUB35517.1 hypothetical protein OHN38_11550 [Streptomyces sp. NBC_00588]